MRLDRWQRTAASYRLAACAVAVAAWPRLGVAQAGPPDALVQRLAATAQENFWGRAVLSSGEKVQPIDDAERIAPIIPLADSARVVDGARPVGQAIWCNVEWQPYYLAFMQAERRKPWSEKQIAFIGMLFGLTQGAFATALTQGGPCSEETRASLVKSIGAATQALRP